MTDDRRVYLFDSSLRDGAQSLGVDFNVGDKQAIAQAEQKLPEVFGVLERQLEGRNFVASAGPSIADLSIASSIFQLGFAQAVPKSPHIGAWFGRVGELRGFKASLPPPPPT